MGAFAGRVDGLAEPVGSWRQARRRLGVTALCGNGSPLGSAARRRQPGVRRSAVALHSSRAVQDSSLMHTAHGEPHPPAPCLPRPQASAARARGASVSATPRPTPSAAAAAAAPSTTRRAPAAPAATPLPRSGSVSRGGLYMSAPGGGGWWCGARAAPCVRVAGTGNWALRLELLVLG